MNTIKERLEFIMNSEHLRQKDLASLTDSSPQTVNNWMKRNAISRFAAQALSEKLGYSLSWILTGVGSPRTHLTQQPKDDSIPPESEWGHVDSWDKNTPLDDDEVEVPFLKDIEFACGSGRANEDDYNGFKIRFSKATLRRVGARTDGSGVLCFPARGNSMEPFIPDGATVAINCDDKKIVDGKVYAVNLDGWKRLKMLYRVGPDRVSLRSYNSEEHPPEDYHLSDVEIVGRMFWTSILW
ncbi:helix-turn-helix domain-containing protein [Enterobacter cloacae]|uniref:LexA family transcriptional regulator n=1 Tax=Enterobacter cloacae TaxID=550 RepID=UPI0020065DF8|nr:S24 family peptidase [Enterobacter cloacae]MCK7174367.1 helix-turn-helix domain-containing protein [Enterobacter cloacae]